MNLIREPWFRVLREGRVAEVSPLEALATPGLLPAFHPYEEAPALRFLLHLVAWSFQGEDGEEVALLPPRELALGVEERTREVLEAFDLASPAFFLRGEGEENRLTPCKKNKVPIARVGGIGKDHLPSRRKNSFQCYKK